MSNLDYPISVLTAEGKEIRSSLQSLGNDIIKKTELIAGINRAISILRARKILDEIEEREKKEKAIPYTKKL